MKRTLTLVLVVLAWPLCAVWYLIQWPLVRRIGK